MTTTINEIIASTKYSISLTVLAKLVNINCVEFLSAAPVTNENTDEVPNTLIKLLMNVETFESLAKALWLVSLSLSLPSFHVR
jgi:hypothetical protein